MSGANTEQHEIVGRARRDGSRLVREWFQQLSKAEENNEKVAYVFVMGSLNEILKVFDMHTSFPEITALQTAVRKVSMHYLNVAEDYGYSPDICGYVKADVGVHLENQQHPMGFIPKPNITVATNTCNTYIKWGEIWERFYGTPCFVFDFPLMRQAGRTYGPGHPEFEADRKYVQAQIEELIEMCEQITGKKFDIDRLREIMLEVNKTAEFWKQCVILNQNVPAPFSAMSDGLTYMGMLNIFRGLPEGTKYMQDLKEELEYKVQQGMGAIDDERFRLFFVGTACYIEYRKWIDMFEEWGGTFVHSEYLQFAGGGLTDGIEYDVSRPLESLSEQLLITAQQRMGHMWFAHDEHADIVNKWKADGVVYHAVKSCRTVSTSMADDREYLIHEKGIPCLHIESDLVDPRCWSAAQMKNRIDAFFEALAHKKALAGSR